MFRSDASFKARSGKGGLLKALRDRRLVASYRRTCLAISPGSSRGSGLVLFSKATQQCGAGQKAERIHLRRLLSSSFAKRAFWMLQDFATKLLVKAVPQKSSFALPFRQFADGG